jgi:hypothetical protein
VSCSSLVHRTRPPRRHQCVQAWHPLHAPLCALRHPA